jgi:acetylornithine deacetylase/succinyl-diaminopimelate desuccinylase-like protein
MLEYLCLNIGHRLSGSPAAAAAVEWTRQTMEAYGFDTVFLQPVMVPHWVRGKKEIVRVTNSASIGNAELHSIAIGNSVGTGPEGVHAEIVEVQDFDELISLGEEGVRDKIVFFNRGFDQRLIKTFRAYGGAVNQRGAGASNAARLGAKAVIVRSMASNNDHVPHTGALRYADDAPKIPAVAISTADADALSAALKKEGALSVYIETHCEMLPDVLSYNVIGEIRGTDNPDEYLVVGGHLDSWDVGHGAHDDGAGCVQSIEALRILNEIGYKPRHSIRAVMFMNEENGLRGGRKYAEMAGTNNETHIAAIESDAGGFSPRGFRMSGSDKQVKKLQSWGVYLNPFGLYELGAPGGGADIGPLRELGTVLFGLSPDSQRYFNYHHTAEDTFDKVNRRELELGAAAMTSLLYLLDSEGI